MSLDFSVNYVAVLVATIAVMVFGFVFFLPQVFGARWMALIGRPAVLARSLGASTLAEPRTGFSAR